MKERLLPRVRSVFPQDDFSLVLDFDNGERRRFDAKPVLRLPCFAPLNNLAFFKSVRVERGTVAWENDIDFCPDTLYMESIAETDENFGGRGV